MNLCRSHNQPTDNQSDCDTTYVSGEQRDVLNSYFLWEGKRKVLVGKKNTTKEHRERWGWVEMWSGFHIGETEATWTFLVPVKAMGEERLMPVKSQMSLKSILKMTVRCSSEYMNGKPPVRISSSKYTANVVKLRYFYTKYIINLGTLWLKLLLKPKVKPD